MYMSRVMIGMLFPFTLFAQTATTEGIVTDPSGAAVPDASVVAVLESTGASRETGEQIHGEAVLVDYSGNVQNATPSHPGPTLERSK